MIGIIGGTGLYQMDGLEITEKKIVNTPFGNPSAPLSCGTLNGDGGDVSVVFLPRHGEHHEYLPSEINFRANIYALKSVGVRQILSVSAVGSLVKEVAPGQLALPAQYIDFTKGRRVSTFFGDGLSAHVSTAKPVCSHLTTEIEKNAAQLKLFLHKKCTYACVEGPRFGTQAESFFLKSTGAQLVGMTNVPEVFLAREAQICYATLAIATDYDCWLDDPTQHAEMDKVLELYKSTLLQAKMLLKALLPSLAQASTDCSCRHSLQGAMVSSMERLSAAQKSMFRVLKE